MNFKGATLIFILIKLTFAFDFGSVNYIEEIVEFITGVVESVSDEKIKAAEVIIDGITIEGKQNFSEIFDKYFIEYPHGKVTDQELEKLETWIKKMDAAWLEFRSKEISPEDREFLKTLPKILKDMYRFYVGLSPNNRGFLFRVNSDWRPWCREVLINWQLRHRRIHQILILTELRGFILALKASDDPQKSAARAIFHSSQYVISTRRGMQRADKGRKRCDPIEHIRGETFSEFVGLFQGIIVNEAQVNENDDDKCPNDCYALENKRLKKCYEESINGEKSSRCYSKPCNGELIECYWIGDVRACESNEKSEGRFVWAQNAAENRFFGSSFNTCDGKVVDFISRLSASGTSTCNNCMCTCAEIDGNSTAVRTISLIPQVTDFKNNMVMTGIKFTEKDQMFHLQIEQAQLAAYGEIVPGTEEWVALGDFEYDSTNGGSFRIKKGDKFVNLKEYVDYSFVSLDQRTINLDPVYGNEGEVLIGARFVVNADNDAFELEVLSLPVDMRTGKLADGDPGDRWIGWQNTHRFSRYYNWPRTELEIGVIKEPLKADDWNEPISWPNQKLLIRATAYASDMAQHTVPYVDIQPLTWPDGRVPLEGLDVVYYRARNFGGFLGFRIWAYDFSKEFGWKMPRSAFNKYRPLFEGNLVLQEPI